MYKKRIWLYYENIFDKNPTFVDLYEDSIQNLDKESIEIDE